MCKGEQKMNIRRAGEKDIPRLIELLQQVLDIHAKIRPDIFISGTTKYTNDELLQMIKDDTNPIYVVVNESDLCLGYAFCQLKEQPFSNCSLRSGTNSGRSKALAVFIKASVFPDSVPKHRPSQKEERIPTPPSAKPSAEDRA